MIIREAAKGYIKSEREELHVEYQPLFDTWLFLLLLCVIQRGCMYGWVKKRYENRKDNKQILASSQAEISRFKKLILLCGLP
jgi:p-aminobenzoyl-glutamate transporter AbgT